MSLTDSTIESSSTALAVFYYEPHPIAELLPSMAEREELTRSVEQQGRLLEEIVVYEGRILDGYERYLACRESGVPLRIRTFDPAVEGDPTDFVLDKNLRRTRLKDPQLAMVAARLVSAKIGYNQHRKEGTTIVEASQRVGVHPKMVERAKYVLEKSAPAAAAVADLKISIGVAEKLAKLPPTQQELILATNASPSALRKTIHRNLQELRNANPAAVPQGRFAVIVSDPPWKVDDVPYPTMTVKEIADYHQTLLAEKAAESCRLFLWTTQAFLSSTFQMIEGWGWKYECTMVWHKSGGHQHPERPQYNLEFVVVASKGSPPYADTRRFPACFTGERRDHSRKPDEFYQMVARTTAGPRLELFERKPHEGFKGHSDGFDWSSPSATRTAITVKTSKNKQIKLRKSSTAYSTLQNWLMQLDASSTYALNKNNFGRMQ